MESILLWVVKLNSPFLAGLSVDFEQRAHWTGVARVDQSCKDIRQVSAFVQHRPGNGRSSIVAAGIEVRRRG